MPGRIGQAYMASRRGKKSELRRRPLKFETPELLEEKINEYFSVTPKEEWTWTGLALHLDTSRETLREYKERPEFVDSLKKALLKVENSYELDLKKHGRSGTIFALKNFDWKDKSEQDITTQGEKIQSGVIILPQKNGSPLEATTETDSSVSEN